MAQPLAPLATYDDLLKLRSDVRAEVIAGAVVTLPSPLPRHSKAQGALRRFVGGPFDDDDDHGGPGGWWIFAEVDVRLSSHDIVRPDLAGWKRSRLPKPGAQRPIDVVPDWVCEILSAGNSQHDRVTKLKLYAEHGIPHYWMVDPQLRTLEALKLNSGHWVIDGVFTEASVARIAPFIEIELPVARLFLPRDADDLPPDAD